MIKNIKGFSFVELMVVTSILAILGTVGFYSVSGYMVTARDSSRVIELENINSSLKSYILKGAFYPNPENKVDVTYSGGLVFSQGEFGDLVSEKVGYSEGVIDPKTKNRYSYSIKNSRKEFLLGAVLEKNPNLSYSNFVSDGFANGDLEATALVTGNYNGELVTVLSGSTNYILALPSIVSSDLSNTDLVSILDGNKLVIDGYSNLPASYSGTEYNLNGGVDFAANELLVYEGKMSNLKLSYNQIHFLQDLYMAYSGSVLGNTLISNKLDYDELFASEPSVTIKSAACDVVNFKLKYFVKCGGIDFITFFVVNILQIDISNLPGNKISAVYQGADGEFLFGTNDGIAFFDPDTNDWVVYDKQNSELVNNNVTTVTQDNSGNYWIGTVNGLSKLDPGVSLIDTSDDIWVTYGKDVLVSSHIQYIYTDETGSIWIGTNKGITSYDGEVWEDYTAKTDGLSHNNITAIFTDSIGNVWFGTNSQGVDKYNLSNGTVTNYDGKTGSDPLTNHKVNYVYEDSNSRVWVGTEYGLNMTPDYGNTWNKIYSDSNLPVGNNFGYIFEDSDLDIWVGTEGGAGEYAGSVSTYESNSWNTYTTTTVPSGSLYLLDNHIHSIYEDESSYILIFSDGGLDTIDDDLGEVLVP